MLLSTQSDHITTFLSKITVSRADQETSQPINGLNIDSEVMTDQPPFSVVGIASEPFLARIRLDWVGGPSKPLIVTHWVRVC